MVDMMDYIFYRFYNIFVDEEHKDPFYSTVLLCATLWASLTMCIWVNILCLIFRMNEGKVVAIILAYLFLLYYEKRCRKKKGEILSKYKSSKYNQKIPDWMIRFIAVFILFGGLALMIMVQILFDF